MKQDSPAPSFVALSLCLGMMIFTVYGVVMKIDENRSMPTSEPAATVTMPAEQPTSTVAPLPTPEQTITPTVVTIELDENVMALPTGSDGSFKSYEKITSIRQTDSKQYALKQFYRTDELGFMRFNDYYVVAIGQFYSKRIGEMFRVTFEERSICVIVGDVKRIEDTVNGQYCRQNGSIIEFIINPEVMSDHIQTIGDVSSLGMGGKLLSVEKEIIE